MATQSAPKAVPLPAVAPSPVQTVYVSFVAEINQQTIEPLMATCSDLVNKRIPQIYLMLSTPGGMVMHGMTLYSFLRGLPVDLVTHNIGNVDSIGNVIFLAGEKRYCTPSATFMFHGIGFDVLQPMRFEEKLLRERMDSIKADQKRMGAIITDRTGIKPEEVEKSFLEAATRDPEYAKAHGIVHEIRDLQVPLGGPIVQLVFKR